jgi:hypothetical protein
MPMSHAMRKIKMCKIKSHWKNERAIMDDG